MPAIASRSVTDGRVADQTLGIVLAAVLCSIALGLAIVVPCLALRRRQYVSSRSPAIRHSLYMDPKTMVSLAGRPVLSRGSAAAPEAFPSRPVSAIIEQPARLSITQRPSVLRASQIEGSGALISLADIDEPRGSHEPILRSSQHLSPLDEDAAEPSTFRYHHRSIDLFDAASPSRYSDSLASNRLSRDSRSESLTRPPVRHFSTTSSQATNSGLRSPSPGMLVSPLIPAKHPQRRLSPMVHYPSWNEVQDFDFNDAEKRISRPKSVQLWGEAGGDNVVGRYELG